MNLLSKIPLDQLRALIRAGAFGASVGWMLLCLMLGLYPWPLLVGVFAGYSLYVVMEAALDWKEKSKKKTLYCPMCGGVATKKVDYVWCPFCEAFLHVTYSNWDEVPDEIKKIQADLQREKEGKG